jgi:hypothetical protein
MYVGFDEGGCQDVATVKLEGFTLVDSKQLAALLAERDALSAEVKKLTKDRDSWKNAMARAASVLLLHKLPTKTINVDKALAEIRAEAGRAGFVEGATKQKEIGWCSVYGMQDGANQYAEQIRQGGAK